MRKFLCLLILTSTLALTACAQTSTVDDLEAAVRESAAMDAMIPGTPPSQTPRSR